MTDYGLRADLDKGRDKQNDAVSKAADARREEKEKPEHEQDKALIAVCDKIMERE